jgi:hypothetical protein
MPYGIPDDPMIREIERTGYPAWCPDDEEEEPDETELP